MTTLIQQSKKLVSGLIQIKDCAFLNAVWKHLTTFERGVVN